MHCILYFLLLLLFFLDDILILVIAALFLFFMNNSYNLIYKGYSVEHRITMVLSFAGSGGIAMPRS